MDLFGTTMFPDASGDGIPMMYLRLLRDLDSPTAYNWGGAVLAQLYRSLCTASQVSHYVVCYLIISSISQVELRLITSEIQVKARQMYGPVLLLQHWSWSRLRVGRPIPNKPEPKWGNKKDDQGDDQGDDQDDDQDDDPERWPVYGNRWYGVHCYRDEGHGRTIGIRMVRLQLQSLDESEVEWTPYAHLYEDQLLPLRCLEQRDSWWYRGPLVCFWIVEHHYPDRVLRQYGEEPLIPVDPALPRQEIKRLHK